MNRCIAILLALLIADLATDKLVDYHFTNTGKVIVEAHK